VLRSPCTSVRCFDPSDDRRFTVIAVVLCVLAAGAYGTSDFAAGLASRRLAPAAVTGGVEAITLIAVAATLAVSHGHGPSATALGWGAISGLGTALGTLSLYRGLSVARMSVVATLSAVLTAVIPVIVGVALGEHLTIWAELGIAIAIPAIALISRQTGEDGDRGDRAAARSGMLYGSLAGVGFALLFIALDRAGTHSGAWPLLPGQIVALIVIAPFAWRAIAAGGSPQRSDRALIVGAGALSAIANLLFLAATGRGQLAIIAVVTSLYPAATVVLARAVLSERWTRTQATGLLTSFAAIVLVSAH
jgi:drug/metabolite transporter (DMT)-like permease